MDSLYLATQILLVEDNRADIELVCKALREHKIHCDLHIISDGEDALAFIEGLDLDSKLTCPNVMLLALHLPKCDGLRC
jgi:two-component system, chemotaxis family, response regulator Rcp1